MWYVNAAKNNLKILDSILVSAYKFVLGLPKNSANKVYWSLLSLLSLSRIITKISENLYAGRISYIGIGSEIKSRSLMTK